MKKYILYLILMSLTTFSFAQKLTTPEVVGYQTGTSAGIVFPFKILGIPFSYINGSIWNAKSTIVAELYISYYMEGDPVKYVNKVVRKVNVTNQGHWKFDNLTIEPLPYAIPGTKMVDWKTVYSLFIYQEYNNQQSARWNINIQRHYPKVNVDKIPDQNKGPKVILPKDKIILNPQPIPPKEIKKKLKGNL